MDFNICVTTPGTKVTTSSSAYTTDQLVNNVLLDGQLQATNITSSTGTDFGAESGLGSFSKGTGAFPINFGVILATGNIAMSHSTNGGASSGSDAWPGDTDVLSVIQQVNPTATSSNDATKLEFDFVAPSGHFSMEYVFASEEYGDWQCAYSDAFVIMLTDIDTQTTAHLGIIPGSTTPVTSVTIKNSQYNSNCSSLNPQFFGAFYYPNNTNAPISYNGRTVLMTAEAVLQPGHNYHVKIAIADRSDHQNDAALFIKNISFNLPPALERQVICRHATLIMMDMRPLT